MGDGREERGGGRGGLYWGGRSGVLGRMTGAAFKVQTCHELGPAGYTPNRRGPFALHRTREADLPETPQHQPEMLRAAAVTTHVQMVPGSRAVLLLALVSAGWLL